MFVCPVCGLDQLREPPYFTDDTGTWASYEGCPCCGFQFGYDDYDKGWTHAAWRTRWLSEGANWACPACRPDDWNLDEQLRRVLD